VAYKRAMQINPRDPVTGYNLGNVYRVIGDEEMAIELYRFVIGLK